MAGSAVDADGRLGGRLGFSIRIYGDTALAAVDAHPLGMPVHLSARLVSLRDIALYLQARGIRMYRLHGRLAPLAGDGLPQQLAGCAEHLRLVGEIVRTADIRLSFHPYSAAVLSAASEDLAARSFAILGGEVALLDGLLLSREAVVVVHVGGVYDSHAASRERFIQRYEALPEAVQRRLVLEQDDRRFSFADVRFIHERTGVPLVFDNLHHDVLNPEGVPAREALAYCLATWPTDVRPKIHYASPRTELKGLGSPTRTKMPSWTEHADCVNPFEFRRFMDVAAGLPTFDIMLEAKARDLALHKLRQDLARYAPDLSERLR